MAKLPQIFLRQFFCAGKTASYLVADRYRGVNLRYFWDLLIYGREVADIKDAGFFSVFSRIFKKNNRQGKEFFVENRGAAGRSGNNDL